MEINVTEHNQVNVVSVIGNIDASNAENITNMLEKLTKEGKTFLVGDFSKVDYISSAGLRVILSAMKAARNQKGDFRLANVQTNVHRILEHSGFTRLLKLYTDVDSAITSF